MGAPLKPRVRRKITNPNRARYGSSNALKRLWDDPVTRPLMLERQRAYSKRGGRPEGVADGTTKEQITALRHQAEERADRIISAMAKNDADLEEDLTEVVGFLKAHDEAEQLVDDDKATARRAMKEAIIIAIMPGNRQTKLAALRTVLEYVKAKPASTTNTNLNAAEEFLAALAHKEK